MRSLIIIWMLLVGTESIAQGNRVIDGSQKVRVFYVSAHQIIYMGRATDGTRILLTLEVTQQIVLAKLKKYINGEIILYHNKKAEAVNSMTRNVALRLVILRAPLEYNASGGNMYNEMFTKVNYPIKDDAILSNYSLAFIKWQNILGNRVAYLFELARMEKEYGIRAGIILNGLHNHRH